MADLPDFVSPIDGKVVHGRAGLREHNRQHNVTNPADYKEQWAKQASERDKMYTGDTRFDSKKRKEAIIRAVNKHWR